MSGFPEKVLLASDRLESTAPASGAAVEIAKGGAELRVAHVWHAVPFPHHDTYWRDAGREALDERVRRIEEGGGTGTGAPEGPAGRRPRREALRPLHRR